MNKHLKIREVAFFAFLLLSSVCTYMQARARNANNALSESIITDISQKKNIAGIITDENGDAVIGASISVKGMKSGTVSDMGGNFSLNNVPENATLTISYIGYSSQNISVEGRTNFKIVLKENAKSLDEVVVVGFGSMKKSDLTGSVASANIKDFEKEPNVNLIQSLQGTVPGLNIGQIASAGSTPDISIRGKNTISGNTGVLIVLDGIIYNGSLSSISPADIESVDVLKDASASAVYGSQASNGVLLITSKRGKIGKAKINFSSSYTFENPTHDLHPMNRAQILDWDKEVCWHDAYTEASGYTEANSSFKLANVMPDSYMVDSDGNIVSNDYNWWKQFTRTGTIFDNKFSVSAGNETSSYFISLANTTQHNFLLNDDFKRNSIRVNLDAQPRKWWKLGIQAFGSFVNQDGQETYLPYLVEESPLALPYDDDGNMIDYPMHTAVENPFHGSMVDDYERHNYFFANLYTEIKLPLKGLTYRMNFGNNYTVNNHNWASQYANSNNGEAYKEHSDYYDYALDNILSYINKFGKHSVNATLVYGASRRKYLYTKADADIFSRITLGYNSLEQGTNQYTSSDAWKDTSLHQLFRVNYKYNDRYLLTTTLRRDGYSGFAANHKFGTFPSVALGWVISEEPFFKVPGINYLKLRSGWGVSGNQTSRYSSLSNVSSSIGYIYGDGDTGVLRQELTTLGNSDLKWERTTGINLGLDFTLLKNRITGSVDAYKTTTKDLLYNVSIPTITGFSSILSNIGKIQNKGIEFTITSRNIITKKFEWSTTFNISSNSNKIKSLSGSGDMASSNLFIGKSLSAIYDYKVDGIYQVNDQNIPNGYYIGNYKIHDASGDGSISTNDKTIIGKTDPAYRFSIMNKFRYKNLSLSFFINSIQGGKNGYKGRNSSSVTQSDNAIRYNMFTEQANLFWSPQNPNGIYSRSYTGGKISPYRYESRSFIRLQDVTISYDMPRSILSHFKIEGLNFFLNAKNLITITHWHGWDPEYTTSYTDDNSNTCYTGSGYGGRPVMRSFTGGINISF